jgi:hypothetical protein
LADVPQGFEAMSEPSRSGTWKTGVRRFPGSACITRAGGTSPRRSPRSSMRCGCGEDVRTDGTVVFDYVSLGGGICIDITRDVMRLLDQGTPLKEIRTHIDGKYARFGPSTPTPPIP